MGNQAMSASLPMVNATEPAASRPPMKWWQWLLLYPALSLALISAVPTWAGLVQGLRMGVPASEVPQAQDQNRLWGKNFECPSRQEIQWIKTPRNTQIGATVCPSGDVLVLAKRPESEQMTFRWLSVDTLERQARSLFGPTRAYAEPRDAIEPRDGYNVMSQRWLKPGLLKQRVRHSNGGCVDLVINSYTGAVVKRSPVKCGAEF